MKKALKRLSAAIIALALSASLMPITAGSVFADETDADAPAASSESEPETAKETEKPKAEVPKETEKPAAEEPKDEGKTEAEAPKETEKPDAEVPEETEAPKETEKPDADAPEETEAPKEAEKPEAEAPKESDKTDEDKPTETETPSEDKAEEPGQSDPKAPKKDPAPEGTINAAISNSKLTWEEYSGADYYEVRVSGENIWFDDDREADIDRQIDYLIRAGKIQNKSPFKVEIFAFKYDDVNGETVIATWSKDYAYQTDVVAVQPGNITASISNGVLTWTEYPGTDHYWIYIKSSGSEPNQYDISPEEGTTSLDLKKTIDRLIKGGNLTKASPYNISMVAEDGDGIALGKWDGESFTYNSSATPVVVGTITNHKVTDGVLSWNAFEGAEVYAVSLIYPGCTIEFEHQEGTSFNINNKIDEEITIGSIEKEKPYTVGITAYDSDGVEIASVSFEYDYDSPAVYTPPAPLDKITGASVSEDGILTWNAYPGTSHYWLYISEYDHYIEGDMVSANLKDAIDRGIRMGRLENSKSYSIRLVAENENGEPIAEWDGPAFAYESTATPIVPAEFTSAKITDGKLTWSAFAGASGYGVDITEHWSDSYNKPATVDVNHVIDSLIKGGTISKSKTYPIDLVAYDEEYIIIARWHYDYPYDSNATPIVIGNISGVHFENGVMTWNNYADTDRYLIKISDCPELYDVYVNSFEINRAIDRYIKAGKINKSKSYTISIEAEDEDGLTLATWSGNYNYDSNANPVVVGQLTAAISENGILTWEEYSSTNWSYYYIVINDDHYCYPFNSYPITNSYDLNARIDLLIKAGELKKTGSYKIELIAEDVDSITVATWVTTYDYDSKAEPVQVKKLSTPTFKKGVMSWKAYSGAAYYCVYVYDCETYLSKTSLGINAKIDWLIKARQISKGSPYPIQICAYDKDNLKIAEWTGNYKYSSSANPIPLGEVANVTVSDKGIMSWDAVKGTKKYVIYIDGCYMPFETTSTSMDLNDFVSRMVNSGNLGRSNRYKIWISADNSEKISIAEGDTTYSYAPTDIGQSVTVTGVVDKTYTGKEISQEPVVTLNGKTLVKDVDYYLEYFSNVNGGTAMVTIGFKGVYIGTYSQTFEIEKAANPLSAKPKTTKVKYKKVRKKAQKLSISKVISLTTGNDPKTYKKLAGSKKISINPTNGLVTIKKKTKKGKYKITVQIQAHGNSNYEAAPETKTVTFTIRIK